MIDPDGIQIQETNLPDKIKKIGESFEYKQVIKYLR